MPWFEGYVCGEGVVVVCGVFESVALKVDGGVVVVVKFHPLFAGIASGGVSEEFVDDHVVWCA